MSDPYWDNVVLLLHCDGSNESTTFTDEREKTVTPNGNAQISTTQSKFGGSSARFDGSGDYLTIIDSTLNVTGMDYAAECWVYLNNLSNIHGIFFWGDINSNNNRIQVDIKTDGSIALFMGAPGGDTNYISAAGAIEAGSWNHLAATLNGTTMNVYLNGVSVGAGGTRVAEPSAGSRLYVGAARNGGLIRYLNGYIDEFRITKGVARYTENFTPPASEFSNFGPQLPFLAAPRNYRQAIHSINRIHYQGL